MGDTSVITPKVVFNLIRTINDPEHPKTLEQLEVVQEKLISVKGNHVTLTFTPTIPHCSMATLIGLCIRVRLERGLPPNTKFDVSITPGTHAQEQQISKQLRDKERVSAALENPNLLDVVERCIEETNIDNPLFFNPEATCGNSSGTSVEENKANPPSDGGCCGGHGGDNDEKKSDGCCGGNNAEKNDQCCQSEENKEDKNIDNKTNDDDDECCGGEGNDSGCCKSSK